MRVCHIRKCRRSFAAPFQATVEYAPRGHDTAELEKSIQQYEGLVRARENEAKELLELSIVDRSRAARERLRAAEVELERAVGELSERRLKRDTMTSASVMRKLDAISEALATSPLNIVDANRVLRQAIRKMVMRPAKGTLHIYWHHTGEPQEISLYTRRFRWEPPPWETQEEAAE
jgi:hypothetical protein